MADIESNIGINIDTSNALSSLKALQSQISAFHTTMAKSGALAASELSKMQNSLMNGINRTGEFDARLKTIKTTAESFSDSLEKNKLTMGQYFRYAGGATKDFGRLFKGEFDTIEKVARERVKDLQTQYIKLGRDANGAMKSISIRPLVLDLEDAGTKTQILAQKQQLLNQLLKQGSTNMLNWGKNTQWAGRQLMVGFTIPLTMLGQVAAKTFMDMEQSVIKFQRVYGDFSTTAAQTKEMTTEITNLAKSYTKYGVAVADTMAMAADAAAMGKMGADLTAQVQSATNLAVLGGIDQKQALETTISLTNAFGIAADDLTAKINFLNVVENQTVTSIEDLTIAVPKAAPVIKQLGGSVEDLAFFLTAMKEGGINASEGANALKSGIASIINPTKKASDMLNGFGVNIKGIVTANKGDVKGMVMGVAEALNKLDPLKRAQAIEQLFGKFQFARISTLFKNITDVNSQATKVAQLAAQGPEASAILAQRELKKIEDSPLFKFKKALEDLKVSLIPLGEQFLKAVTPLADVVRGILEWFNKLPEGMKDVIGKVTLGLGILGPVVLMTIGLVANGVANLIKIFATFKGWINSLGKGSQDLGSQTAYMTSAQIEAAAVAASLDQVHSKLKQTFTSEAAAIANLTTQLGKAVAAQSAYMNVGVPGKAGGPRRKMANGGMVVGPGGPKDDLVPTDLSNGEAVIDAETVRKNPRIIGALFQGKKINIPGYSKNNSSQFVVGKYSAPEAVRQQTAGMNWESRGKELAAIESLVKELNLTQAQARELLSVNASHITPGESKSKKVGNMTAKWKEWEANNIVPDLGAVNQYLNSLQMSSGVLDTFSKDQKFVAETAKKLGISQKKVREELDSFAKGIHPTTKSGYGVLQSVATQDFENQKAAGKVSRGRGTQAGAVSVGLAARNNDEYLKTQKGRYDASLDAKANRQAEMSSTALAKRSDTQAESAALTPAQKAQATRKRNAEAKAQADAQALQEKQARSQARSDAAAKGWETRRANAEANAPKQSVGSRIVGGAKKLGGKIMGGGVGAGMGLGMAGMAVGMIPGMEGVGQAVSMAGMIPALMPMLANPIGIAALAIGGLTAGIIALNAANEENKKKQIALGNASVMSAEKMISISKTLGTVTATEARRTNQSASLAGISGEQMSEAETFLTSDAGKGLLADVKTQKEGGKTDQQIADDTVNNLANLVAQGAMSKEMASGVMTAMGQQTGNFNLTAGSARLQELSSGNVTGIGANAIDQMRSRQTGLEEKTITTYNGSYSNLQAIMPKLREESVATANTYSQIVGQADILAVQLKNNVITQEEYNKQMDINKQQQNEVFASAQKIKQTMGDSNWSETFAKNIEESFGADSEASKTAKKINDLKDVDPDFKLRMQMNLESGALTPDVVNKFIEMSENNAEFGVNYSATVGVIGQTATDTLMMNMLMTGKSDKEITAVLKLVQSDEEYGKALTTVTEGAKAMGIDISGVNLADADKVKSLAADYEKIKTMTSKGPITMQTVVKEDGGFKPLEAHAKWFNGLPAVQQRYFLSIYKTITDAQASKKVAQDKGILRKDGTMTMTADRASTKISTKDLNKAKADIAKKQTVQQIQSGAFNETPGGGGGGGGSTAPTASDKASAAISILGRKEEKINKAYDERLKALDKIQQANDKINQQKKDQLDLADALSRGDIGAAARAQQQARQTAQSNALQEQRDRMNAAKDAQIAALTVNGMTKEGLEKWQAAQEDKKDSSTLGKWSYKAVGGMITPQYFARGGKPRGTDTVAAMLTPGEFVVKKSAVDKLGKGTMNKINNGEVPGSNSVYNYSINVNVNSESDADEIANVVLTRIKGIDNQGMKGNRA